MAKNITYAPPRPTAWLWSTAGVIIIVAASIILVLRQELPDPQVKGKINRVIAGSALGVGLCVISALSSRWVRR